MLVELLAAAGGDAAVEGDVEGAQGGFPAVGPAGASFAGRVEAAHGQVQHLQRRSLGGEMASGVDRTAEPRVDGLDGVGGTDDAADLDVEAEERHHLCPGV